MSKKIAFVGGGTMGPVTPLLALHKVLSKQDDSLKFIWAGTDNGPEQKVVAGRGIDFTAIPTAKLPRHPSIRWFTFLFDYLKAKQAAVVFIKKHKPDIIIGCGGFSQVPVMKAAAKQGIPCLAHQLDYKPTLSNLMVAKYCQIITTSFAYTNRRFAKCPAERHIATPNRFAGLSIPDKLSAKRHFTLDPNKPATLFVGGGTGAKSINDTVENHLSEWLSVTQVLQITGKGRGNQTPEQPGYVRRDFLDEKEMFQALACADIIVSRAGFGAISDFATLSKPTILIPIPGSQQEENSKNLQDAVIEVNESANLFADVRKAVQDVLQNPQKQQELGNKLHNTVPTDDGSEWGAVVEGYLL